MFAGKGQPDAAIDEQRPEAVQNPVKALDEPNPGDDEDGAHYQRADNSPKQHAVLLLLGHGEVAEDYEEEEKVVDTERELEDVTRDEFDRDLAPLPEKNYHGKCCRQANPHRAESDRLARTHAAAAV